MYLYEVESGEIVQNLEKYTNNTEDLERGYYIDKISIAFSEDKKLLALLLEVKLAPGIEPKIKGQVLEQLQQKLSQPQRLEPHVGFKSYRDIHSWLIELFNLEIGYSTVHRIVRYQFKAKLKVPRPRSRKTTKHQQATYKKTARTDSGNDQAFCQ